MISRMSLAAAVVLAAAAVAPAQPDPLYSRINLSNAASTGSNNTTNGTFPRTFMDLDDITVTAGGASQPVRTVQYSVVNYNTASTINARVLLRFFAADGAGGGPGSFLGKVDVAPTTFPLNLGGALYTHTQSAPIFTVPSDGKFFVGMAFDNMGATATLAQLDDLGQILINGPAEVGSSTNTVFFADDIDTSSNPYISPDPAGGFASFSGGRPNNFAYYFSPVPEPATVLGVAAVALFGFRRLRRLHQPPALLG